MEPYVGYRRKRSAPPRSVTVFWATCDCCGRKGALHPSWGLAYEAGVLVKAVCPECCEKIRKKLDKMLDKVESLGDNYPNDNEEVMP